MFDVVGICWFDIKNRDWFDELLVFVDFKCKYMFLLVEGIEILGLLKVDFVKKWGVD